MSEVSSPRSPRGEAMSPGDVGGDLLVDLLAARGAERIFSVSGGPLNPIYHATLARPVQIIHTRHEAGGGFHGRGHRAGDANTGSVCGDVGAWGHQHAHCGTHRHPGRGSVPHPRGSGADGDARQARDHVIRSFSGHGIRYEVCGTSTRYRSHRGASRHCVASDGGGPARTSLPRDTGRCVGGTRSRAFRTSQERRFGTGHQPGGRR